jgi:hypothetical protein
MGDFSIITDYGGSLQVTLSGSRLEVLGFYYGRVRQDYHKPCFRHIDFFIILLNS